MTGRSSSGFSPRLRRDLHTLAGRSLRQQPAGQLRFGQAPLKTWALAAQLLRHVMRRGHGRDPPAAQLCRLLSLATSRFCRNLVAQRRPLGTTRPFRAAFGLVSAIR